MKGVNTQAAAMQAGMGKVTSVTQQAINPHNQLVDSLQRGKVGMKEMGMAVRDQQGIWQNQQRVIGATGQVMYDAAGNARVMYTRMGEMSAATLTAGQRLRMFNTFLAAGSASLVKWGKNMQWAGRQLTVGFTVPLMMLGRNAANAAEEYDRAMTRVIKVTDFTAEEGSKALEMQMESVRDQTRRLTDLGASWGFMAEETASTMAEFAQMGYIGAQLDQLSDAALRLSFVTGSDLDTSIEATRITAQAFGVELSDLNEEFARLNIVENNTALSVSESMLGLPVVGAVSNAVGMSLQETNGIMAMMKNAGISAKEGATALRTGLLQLVQDATDPTIAAFDKVGLSIEDMKERMQTVGEGDPLYFFDELQGHIADMEGNQAAMNDMSAALSKLFGVRQTARILSFMEQFGDRMDENTAGGKAWKGVMDDTAEVMRVYEFEQRQIEESAAGIADRLRAELNVQMTELGETFLLVANRAREFAVDIMRWFNNLDEGVKKMVMSFGAFMAVLGPVLMLTGLLANAVGNVTKIFTVFLPKMKLATIGTVAQAQAFGKNAAVATGLTRVISKKASTQAVATAATHRDTLANYANAKSLAARTTAAQASIASQGTTGAMGGLSTKMSTAMSGKIAKGGILMKVLSGIGAAAAGTTAAIAGLLAVLAAIVVIPILADPAAFMRGFKEQVAGPFERLVELGGRLKESLQDLIAAFKAIGSDDTVSGLSNIAGLLGRIAGWLAGSIMDAITWLLGALGPLIPLFEAIFHWIDGIATLFTDWDAGLDKLAEGFKALFRALAEFLAWVLDGFEAILRAVERLNIPGVSKSAGEAADQIAGWSDSLRNIDAIQSDVNRGLSQQEQSLKNLKELQEEIGESLQDNASYIDDMIDSEILSEKWTLRNVAANMDIIPVLERQIKGNEQLTDEMRVRAWMYLDEIRTMKEINDLIRAQNSLRSQEEIAQTPSALGEITGFRIAAPGEDYEKNQKTLTNISRIESRIAEIQEQQGTSRERAAAALGLMVNDAGELVDEFGDLVDETAEFGDELNDAQERMKTFVPALRSQMKNVQSEIADAVKNTLAAEREGVMENFSQRMDNIKDEFSARGDALKERINEEKDAFKEAHQERMDQLKIRHDAEMERFEERRQAERDAIEDAANARIEALEDQEKKETDAERQRERAFEREKARINYLHGMRTGNLNVQLALARGELSSAAIMREQIGTDSANFRLDEARRERGYVLDDRKRARDAEIEMIKDVTKARLESFDEQTKEQKKALEEQQKQTVKALEEQNKAQEKALERRHKMMEDSLKKEQDIAEKRIKTEQDAAEKGFEARERAIDLTLKHWQKVNPQTEKEYRDHLGKLESDLKDHGVEWSGVVNNYAEYSGERIGKGFRTAATNAQKEMGENAKWEQFGEAMIADLGNGLGSGISDELRELAEFIGVELPESSRSRPNYPNRPGTHGRGQAQGGTAAFFHVGGRVFGGGGSGIRADEQHAVLQSGEYVIRREAVKAMGLDTMEQINQAHKLRRDEMQYRYHSGGPVDWQKQIDGRSTPYGTGHTFGKFMSYLAAHGARPGFGAMDTGNLEHLPDLIPPDRGETWRFPNDWRTGVQPHVVGITSAILNAIPGGQVVTSAFRPGATVAGTNRPSQHGAGMAVDIRARANHPRGGGNAQTEREGDAIAAAFRAHPRVGQVLWKTMTGGNHYDHVHAGFRYHEGGLIEELPDFSGMSFGNTLARGVGSTLVGALFNKVAEGFQSFMPDEMSMLGSVDANGPIKQYAKNMLSQFGWGPEQWAPLHNLVQRESTWNPNGQNPNSTAYGLFQFLDSTWAGVGMPKTSDPYQQIQAGYKYIRNRYGTPAAAWDFWQRRVPINGRDVGHWYHQGGPVQIPQLARGGHVNYDNVVANLHKKETVLTSPLSAKLEQGIDRMAAGQSFGDTIVQIENFHGTEENIEQLATRIEQIYEKRAVNRGAKRRFG